MRKVLFAIYFMLLFVCLAPKTEAITNSEGLYAEAEQFFNESKYDNAISIYINIFACYHNEAANACFMLGRCYFELGKYKQARKWFRTMIMEFSNEVRNFAEMLRDYWAASYYYERNYSKALKNFAEFKILEEQEPIPLPSGDHWYEIMRRCYIELSGILNWTETVNLEQLPVITCKAVKTRKEYWRIANDPTKSREIQDIAIYRIAESYYMEGDYKTSIAVLRRGNIDPPFINSSFVYKPAAYMIGRSYYNSFDYESAIGWVKQNLSLYAHPLPVFYYLLAYSYYYDKKYLDVLEILKIMSENIPQVVSSIEYQFLIADSLYSLKRYQEALAEYRKILAQYPDNGESKLAVLQIRKIEKLND